MQRLFIAILFISTVSISDSYAVLTATITVNNHVSCNGGANASITVAVTSGVAPYTYSWSPSGGSGATATNRAAGTYTCTITDASSASITKTATVTQPTLLSSTGSQTNVNCNGQCTGIASVSPSGGTSPYTYSWAPSGGSSASTTGRCAGTYTVTVTDANSCIITRTYSLTQPSALTATQSQVNLTCNAACSGSATVVASGGTAAYTYSWAPSGGTGATASSLCAGTKTCTITDAYGCAIAKSFTITQPPALSATQSQVNVSCNGMCNGSATVSPFWGTPGYNYSWAPAGGSGATASSLCAGTYTCTINDANWCTITKTFTITQLTTLSAGSSSSNISCFGGTDGSATVTPSGGTSTYSYSWAPSGGSSATASSLAAGNYTCTITDGNNCTLLKTFALTQPAVLGNNTISGAQTVCSNIIPTALTGSTPTGATGTYGYAWISSTTSASAGFSSAAGTNNTINYSPSGLITTTWFKRIVTSGSCSADTSASVQITVNHTNTWSGGTSTAWGIAGNWSCGRAPVTSDNCVVANTSNLPVITGSSFANNLTINSGASLQLSGPSAWLSISGSITNNGTFTTNVGKISFTGTATQTVPAGTYQELEINNAAGVNTGGNITATTLTLSSGTVTIQNNDLSIAASGSISGANSSRYIITDASGTLIFQSLGSGGNTANVTFPVGTAASYTPVILKNIGSNDDYSVRVENGVNTSYDISGTPTGSTVLNNAVDRTWMISELVTGGSNVNITIQWNAADELSGFLRNNCYVSHFYNSAWQIYGSGASSGSGPYTRSIAGLQDFSPFGIGSLGTLPVTFIDFKGNSNGSSAVLKWSTSTEINNNYFQVERSSDLDHFEILGKVKGNGNSVNINQYNYDDKTASDFAKSTGTNDIYYRLKQVDFDGKYEYSKLIKINFSESIEQRILIHPNPVLGNEIFIPEIEADFVELRNMNGVVIAINKSISPEGTQISFPEELKAGIYSIIVVSKEKIHTIKLIRQ